MDIPETLARLSERHGAAWPDRQALVFGRRCWTWSRLHGAVLSMVGALRASGLQAGGRVAYLGHNSDGYVVLLLACYRAGIVLAPLNWRLAPSEIAFLVQDSRPRLLVVDQEFVPLLAQIDDAIRPEIVIVEGSEGAEIPRLEDWAARHVADSTDPVDDPETTALLLYSSGTTGFPKGVLLSHRNLVSGFRDAAGTGEAWGVWDETTVAMLATPIFHIGGTGWVTQALIGGALTIVLPRPDVGAMVAAIGTHHVTKLFAVPAMLGMILDDPAARRADFGSVRHLLYGASPIPLDLLRRAMRKFANAGFVQLYGATETTGVATWLPAGDHHPEGAPRMASCGKAYAGTDIRVIDADGALLPAGGIGEIAIRSDCVMQGYLGRPEATEAAICDGWYRTGDAGYLDTDGYLYIYDRVKDMIVSGGENIYPAEVERALADHPAVRDCALIGVPDGRWGEAGKAIVVLTSGMDVAGEELRQFLRGRIAGYKIPKTVEFVAELPRTPSGKVLKRELRKPYWPQDGRQIG